MHKHAEKLEVVQLKASQPTAASILADEKQRTAIAMQTVGLVCAFLSYTMLHT